MSTIRIFVSYSREDSRWLQQDSLIPWLARSLRRSNVEVWYDREGLQPGEEFRQRIEAEIDSADLAILLVSQGFINSEFIETVELPRIKARTEQQELVVIPILVEPCGWDEIEFLSVRQMIPGKPTPLIDYVESERAWAHARSEILQRIQARIESLLRSSETAPQGPLPKSAKNAVTEAARDSTTASYTTVPTVETPALVLEGTQRHSTAPGNPKRLFNSLRAWATLQRKTLAVVAASLVLLISLYAIVKHYQSLQQSQKKSPEAASATANTPTEIPRGGSDRTSPSAVDGSTVSHSRDLAAPKSYDAEIVSENGQVIRNAELSCGPRGWSSYVASIEYTKDLEVIRTSKYGPSSGRFIGFDKISRLEFLEMDEKERHVIDENRLYRDWIRKFRLTFTDGTVWDDAYLLDHCLFKTNYETGNLEKISPKIITIKLKN